MVWRSEHKIRFDDVDGAGIVYFPRFFDLCHAAFEDLFDELGPASYPELIRHQRLGFPTVAIESQFSAPLEYGDVAVVEVVIDRIGRSSFDVAYAIRRRRDDAFCFRAKMTQVYAHLDTLKPRSLTPELRALFESFAAQPRTPVAAASGA